MTALLRAATIDATDEEFNELRSFIYDTFGISLADEKKSMVESRLRPILSRDGIASFSEYIAKVKRDPTRRQISELVNRISTNHTFFNRESSHFDFFTHTVIPELVKARKSGTKEIRVWCAASSTGQEPYTLAALMMEKLGAGYREWDAGVLATDINNDVLRFAQRGIYDGSDVEQLPDVIRTRYFRRTNDGRYEVKPELRKEVLYRRYNLINKTVPFKRPFDVIFCRNVMIYFDEPTKRSLVERFARFILPGGYLFIGSAESVPISGLPFRSIAPAVFRRLP